MKAKFLMMVETITITTTTSPMTVTAIKMTTDNQWWIFPFCWWWHQFQLKERQFPYPLYESKQQLQLWWTVSTVSFPMNSGNSLMKRIMEIIQAQWQHNYFQFQWQCWQFQSTWWQQQYQSWWIPHIQQLLQFFHWQWQGFEWLQQISQWW